MAHEQTVACLHCGESFRVCIPTDDMFPPKADTIFEADCPNDACGKATSFVAGAGTQREGCDDTMPTARKVVQ